MESSLTRVGGGGYDTQGGGDPRVEFRDDTPASAVPGHDAVMAYVGKVEAQLHKQQEMLRKLDAERAAALRKAQAALEDMGAPAVRKASQAVERASKAEAALSEAQAKLETLQRRVKQAEEHAAGFVLPDGDAAEATTADRLKVSVRGRSSLHRADTPSREGDRERESTAGLAGAAGKALESTAWVGSLKHPAVDSRVGMRRLSYLSNSICSACEGWSHARWFIRGVPFISSRCVLQQPTLVVGVALGACEGEALGHDDGDVLGLAGTYRGCCGRRSRRRLRRASASPLPTPPR